MVSELLFQLHCFNTALKKTLNLYLLQGVTVQLDHLKPLHRPMRVRLFPIYLSPIVPNLLCVTLKTILILNVGREPEFRHLSSTAWPDWDIFSRTIFATQAAACCTSRSKWKLRVRVNTAPSRHKRETLTSR